MARRPLRSRAVRLACAALVAGTASLAGEPASAQTLTDMLSFLLTNRSIATDDFVRDAAAATATRDAISAYLLTELATLPVSSSSGGFTYRLEPTLGTTVRSSNSFGPFFTERSLTSGARQMSMGISYQHARYDRIDGRSLSDGTLIATASRLRSETQPFDTEALTLGVETSTMTVQTNIGVTDRLDVGAALPLIRLRLDGRRVDTYRGREAIQAIASGTSSGPGDLAVRGKYNVMQGEASGVAVGAEARLPTGNEQNLLGSGHATLQPSVIVSLERSLTAVHATAGYRFGGDSGELNLGGAVTVAATPRITAVGELAVRRLSSVGRLVETTAPHPTLANVLTERLSTTGDASTHAMILAGVKWNIGSTWLLNASVMRSLTDAGLDGGWTPMIAFDRSFGP